MGKIKDFIEQRQQNRFKAKEGAFAVLMSDPPVLAQIKEISKGGLTVHYFDSGEKSYKVSELDIFLSDHDFHLRSVPFKTTSNSNITVDLSDSSLSMRRHGLKFGKLTPYQNTQLDHLLQNHTVHTT
ncbi:hypothetical protein ACFL03_02090 [Thermodesulfobacteriota bacterium]